MNRKKSDNVFDDSFTVTTKYHYYNSENGKRIETSDKDKVDSILSNPIKVLDTLKTKKKDSLKNYEKGFSN